MVRAFKKSASAIKFFLVMVVISFGL